MNNENIMKSIEKDIIVQAEGKSKEEAYGSAFRLLRKNVYSEIKGCILQMEPKAVYVMEENVKTYTEKFLWLFMSREIETCTIKIRVTVDIKYIDK